MGVFDIFYGIAACLFDRGEGEASEPNSARAPHIGQAHPRPTIPPEIVVSILGAAYENSDAQKTLKACALVCKDWLSPSQNILYRRVTLASAPALNGFIHAVSGSTPRSRALADTVECLRIVIDTKQPRGILRNAFAQAVVRCPNLAELSLAVYHDGCESAKEQLKGSPQLFAADVLSLLQTGPSITTLHFDNWSDNAHALVQLLQAFPSVTSLNISGTPPVLPALPLPPPRAIDELRISCQPSLEFVNWLLRDSTLHVLDFKRVPECELLLHLLLEHCGTLESLALPSCASVEYSLALAQCTRLRELRLEDLWTAYNAKRQLPPSLEHFAFSLNDRNVLEPVINVVNKSLALRRITMHVWTEDERHMQLPDLRIACALQGVELDVVRDIQTFRSL
ncbi:uncharacterized protein PHACADRAFT_204853 [Phanerochaete carnosa HHB-10118-sp]|uniref:Uncharacterized protein n=1 Tax=Phanerochaete carnosa (strain HHB-10118-sp) TaxID=650164 RepID=K5WQZ9_PHACS|nr:uncharacterized protein PHACADRAFT_204853 [Phanerochaete carnosa HHB-10118-sp]EKM61684.1 hypothetical protein PHACADRAFT_204853 [Phanerochaete carnosa HHB-10118-sp]